MKRSAPARRRPPAGKTTEELAWDQPAKTCYDPEIPVNIVDLGLVYKCGGHATSPDGGKRVEVRVHADRAGCGMGDVLKEDIQRRAPDSSRTCEDADVYRPFDPPWNMSMMSEAAKLQLGLMMKRVDS